MLVFDLDKPRPCKYSNTPELQMWSFTRKEQKSFNTKNLTVEEKSEIIKTLPIFSAKPHESFLEFINEFEEKMTTFKVNDEDKTVILKKCLKGTASTYFESKPQILKTKPSQIWRENVEYLFTVMEIIRKQEAAKLMLNTTNQEEEEDLEEYALKILRLTSVAFPNDEEQRRHNGIKNFIRGINFPIKKIIRRRRYEDLKSALAAAVVEKDRQDKVQEYKEKLEELKIKEDSSEDEMQPTKNQKEPHSGEDKQKKPEQQFEQPKEVQQKLSRNWCQRSQYCYPRRDPNVFYNDGKNWERNGRSQRYTNQKYPHPQQNQNNFYINGQNLGSIQRQRYTFQRYNPQKNRNSFYDNVQHRYEETTNNFRRQNKTTATPQQHSVKTTTEL